jgi:class 3 adenylate cyclase
MARLTAGPGRKFEIYWNWCSKFTVSNTKIPDHKGDSVQPPETEVRHSRRLKAIFFADVAGYTRLMGKDEENTQTVINGMISDFGKICQANEGEMLDIRGDGIFSVFDSVVGAVRSAIDFQDEVETRNSNVPDDLCVMFRIGIHLGDVLSRAGHYFGDSVNIYSVATGVRGNTRWRLCLPGCV